MEDQPAPESGSPEFSPIPAEQEKFLTGAGRRMNRSMCFLGAAGVVIGWFWEGSRWAGGFAGGALLSALNFHWLTSAVATISEQVHAPDAEPPNRKAANRRRSTGIAVRLMLRYALIGIAGYAIFKSSLVSLNAFLLGLFLFLGAILIEIAYEIYFAFRGA